MKVQAILESPDFALGTVEARQPNCGMIAAIIDEQLWKQAGTPNAPAATIPVMQPPQQYQDAVGISGRAAANPRKEPCREGGIADIRANVNSSQPEAPPVAVPDGVGNEKGEIVSPFSLPQVPPDFNFIVSKTAEEKRAYSRSVLGRSEDEAIAVIAPAIKIYGSAVYIVEEYGPAIEEVKEHFCRRGRPRINPETGQRNRTWAEVCKENLGIGIRRVQQVLKTLREPKPLGEGSPATPRQRTNTREFKGARQVAAPAASPAKAVIEKGLGDTFPEASEIENLANIAVPVVQPVEPGPNGEAERPRPVQADDFDDEARSKFIAAVLRLARGNPTGQIEREILPAAGPAPASLVPHPFGEVLDIFESIRSHGTGQKIKAKAGHLWSEMQHLLAEIVCFLA